MRTALIATVFLSTLAFAAPVPAEPNEAELKEKALKLNKEATNEDAADKKLKELIKDKVNTPRLVKVAAKVLQEAKDGEKPFRFYPALVLAKAAHNAKEYDAADVFYAFCLKNAKDDLKSGKLIAIASTAQIDFYLGRKQYEKAIKACEKFLESDDEFAGRLTTLILEKKFRAMARNNQTDAALEEINRFVKRFRDDLTFLLLKAGVQREAGKFEDAVDTLKDVIDKIENRAGISDEDKKNATMGIRYSLSGLYSELNKIDKSTSELEKLMKDDPKNPTFKNDLGFMWADHDMKLEESEKLIKEAVELDLAENKKALEAGLITEERAKKANPAYIDSLGWVLYKRGKYEEALKHLLESAGADDEESDHIEIWDHVGDCYLKMDKKKEALAAFEKGLTMEDVSKKDAERRKNVIAKIAKLKAELK